MTTRSLNRLFTYNEWAWRRVFPSLAALEAEEYFAERPFFWHSLHGLAVHGYSAEWTWLQRVRGDSPPRRPTAEDFASIDAVRAAWTPLWAEWQEFLGSLTPGALAETVRSRNAQGVEYILPVDDVLRHVINHATEHRSQMTPTLAQLGHPTDPLDYARFAAVEK